MEYKVKEIKQGIKVHLINNDKFKTNLIAVFLTTELNRENVTKNAIIPAILRRGSENMPTQEAISREMEEMYGASFNCGVDKRGDNQSSIWRLLMIIFYRILQKICLGRVLIKY